MILSLIASLCSPDWDSAANDLNKAAVCFKVKYDKLCFELASSDSPDPPDLNHLIYLTHLAH